ncbi:ABATE domain-containing protein [Prauserella sp. ASG 168]|uniref:ABATE domain-containing protein n=1 Tax=Prauserella cavernicola TaxID=2800127 RepID=A0A934QPL4_9PSEU|nr:ABATE domain-containing protein [Prauserella cavernicola]
MATVAKRGMGDREMLATPDDLETWLHVAGLPPAEEPATPSELDSARALREAIHRLTWSRVDGARPNRAAIRVVNDAASAGTPAITIGADGSTAVPAPSAPVTASLALVARDAVELFTGPLAHRIRACIGHDCSLFFVDRSRPGSRRWCAMAACGEKASSASYRQRHPGAR